MRDPRRIRGAVGAMALVLAAPSPGVSPFEGLRRLDGVSTSNDGFGIWIQWEPSSYRLELPGRAPLVRRPRVLGGLIALAGLEFAPTPVQVLLSGGPARPSPLVRKRIDSIARPCQVVGVDPGEALRAIASGSGAKLLAEGKGTRLRLRFDAQPGLKRAAALMAHHCEGSGR